MIPANIVITISNNNNNDIKHNNAVFFTEKQYSVFTHPIPTFSPHLQQPPAP